MVSTLSGRSSVSVLGLTSRPGTVMPIKRHKASLSRVSASVGIFEEYLYDENGNLADTIDMVPVGVVLNFEKGQMHSLKCLESGTVLFESKDGI